MSDVNVEYSAVVRDEFNQELPVVSSSLTGYAVHKQVRRSTRWEIT